MERYFNTGYSTGATAISMPASVIIVPFLIMSLSLLGVVVLLPLITGVTLVLVGIS